MIILFRSVLLFIPFAGGRESLYAEEKAAERGGRRRGSRGEHGRGGGRGIREDKHALSCPLSGCANEVWDSGKEGEEEEGGI